MTAAAWKTVAPAAPSKSRSTTAGSRTSPATASMRSSTTSSRTASSASRTRHRMWTRLGWAARARTRFWPSQPPAPVTTTVVATAPGRVAVAVDSVVVTRPRLTSGRRYPWRRHRSRDGRGTRYPARAPLSPTFCRRERPMLKRARRPDAVALGIVALVFLVPLRGLMRSQGPPMEEGFMLVFPELVLKGQIPNRDFLHLYGPGSLWALAGVYKVFGVSLWSERVFGLLQQLAIVFGIYALARRWGRVLAVIASVTSALIIIPFGFTALAWVGGVGLAVCGLAAGIEARAKSEEDERSGRRWAVAAGILLGLAVLFRLDLILGVGIASIALLRGMPRPRVHRVLAGF